MFHKDPIGFDFTDYESFSLKEETEANSQFKFDDSFFWNACSNSNTQLIQIMDLKEEILYYRDKVSKLKLENIMSNDEVNLKQSNLSTKYHEMISRKTQLEAKLNYLRNFRGHFPNKIEKRLMKLETKIDIEIEQATRQANSRNYQYKNELKSLKESLYQVQSKFKEGIESSRKIEAERGKVKRYLKTKVKKMIKRFLSSKKKSEPSEIFSETRIKLKLDSDGNVTIENQNKPFI